MIDKFRSYFRPIVAYDDPLTQRRATTLLIYLGVSLIITSITSFYVILRLILEPTDGGFNPSTVQIIGLLSPAFVLAWYWGIRNGYYRVTSMSIVFFLILPLLNYWSASLNTVQVLVFILPIIIAGALLGRRYSIITFFVTLALAAGPTIINGNAFSDFVTFLIVYSLIAVLTVILSDNIESIANQFIRELNKLQGVIEARLDIHEDEDELSAMLSTINILRDQLGYTFARIYLVENDEVVRRVQTSLNLSEMTVDTDINFGERSAIYEALRSKDVRVVKENDSELTRQHLFGGTRGALAVPVMDKQGSVIAIIDIQSEETDVFSAPEIQTIKLLARQLGQNLEQLRLIANLREDLAEQDALIAQQRQRLLDFEATERQTTTETWRQYLNQRGTAFMGYDMEAGATSPMEAIDLNDNLESAIQTGDIVVQAVGDQQIVSVPISLRGQSLGAMTFRVPTGSQVIGARQQELIRNVVQRLSLALENKRLFEQSQSQAQRERKANEVGNLLLSTTDIDTVLNLAASNFNEALGAIQTQIRLKPEIRAIGESEGQS